MNDSSVKPTLYFNTASNEEITVGLEISGKKTEMRKHTKVWTSQLLIPLIAEILKKNGFQLKDISKIIVNTGPGSYTGLRIGIAVANVFGWYLGIPVNGKAIITEPVYDDSERIKTEAKLSR